MLVEVVAKDIKPVTEVCDATTVPKPLVPEEPVTEKDISAIFNPPLEQLDFLV